MISNKCVQKLLRKYITRKYEHTQIPNLKALNNSRQIEMILKPIKDNRILLFLLKYYIMKMDIIRYYLLPNSTA